MHKLLSANLRRLCLNKAFWITTILLICVEVIYCLLLSRQNTMPMDFILFISIPYIGIFISAFFSLFLGTEYNDGTIRNKIIVGHKRSSIYLASLITGIIAVTIIYLLMILTGVIIGVSLFATPNFSMGQIMFAGLVGLLACISYIAIFNLIGMLSSSKAKTSITCILTSFILMFVGLMFFSLVSEYQNAVYQFLFEINPFGQTFLVMSVAIDSPLMLVAYSLLLTTALTGCGMYCFCRKNLK